MNEVILIGRLTESPVLKSTTSGVSVCSLRIAIERRSDRDRTDYFTVTTWRGLAESCARHLMKGQRVSVRGELQTRTFEGKDGQKRYFTEVGAEEVEFLDRPKGEERFGGTEEFKEDDLPY